MHTPPLSSTFQARDASPHPRRSTPRPNNVVVWTRAGNVFVDVLYARTQDDVENWVHSVELVSALSGTERIVVVAPHEGLGRVSTLFKLQAGPRLRDAFRHCDDVLFFVDSDMSAKRTHLMVDAFRLVLARVYTLADFGEVTRVLLRQSTERLATTSTTNRAGEASRRLRGFH